MLEQRYQEVTEDFDGDEVKSPSLSDAVKQAVENYMREMGDQSITELYEMVLSEVEAPLLEAVLANTGDNQSRSAKMLGLNRGTLRKKLKKYGML